MKATAGAEPREIHYEETTWKRGLDFFSGWDEDCLQFVLGRQWHQLWMIPANGGDAFPIRMGIGRDVCAVVAGWDAVGVYFESQREYGIVAAANSWRDAAEAGGDGTKIFAASRTNTAARVDRGRKGDARTRVDHG